MDFFLKTHGQNTLIIQKLRTKDFVIFQEKILNLKISIISGIIEMFE